VEGGTHRREGGGGAPPPVDVVEDAPRTTAWGMLERKTKLKI